MASAYPGGLDSFATNKADGTATPTDHPTHHNDLADAVNKIEAELGVNPSGGSATVAAAIAAASVPAGLMYPYGHVAGETPHADDDFFAAYSGYTEQTPTGTAVWSATRAGLTCVATNQSASDLCATLVPIPAAGVPLTIETKTLDTSHATTNNPSLGLIFTDGVLTTSNLAAFGQLKNIVASTTTSWYRFTGTLTNATATVVSPTQVLNDIGTAFSRLVWKSANTFAWSISPDSENWTDFGATDFSTTFTPTHMGLFATTWASAATSIFTFHYLRVYEADLSV